MNNYLADTTLLVEHLRGNGQAKTFLKTNHPNISIVSVAELIQGSRNSQDLTVALKLCGSLSEMVIDKKVSNRAIKLMKEFCLSHGLMFLDALIAATALENRLVLVTENLKHFKFIKGLKIISQEIALKENS